MSQLLPKDQKDDKTELPFHRIPPDITFAIANYLKPMEIFEASLAHKKVCDGFERAKTPVDFFRLDFTYEKSFISFKKDNRMTTFRFFPLENRDLPKEKRQFDSLTYIVTKYADDMWVENNDAELPMHVIFTQMLRLFRCSIIKELVLDLGAISDVRETCEKFRHFKSVQRLEFLNTRNEKNSLVNFQFWSDLPTLLNVLGHVEHLVISVPDAPNVPIPKILAVEHVELPHLPWITKKLLMQFPFKTAELRMKPFMNTDFVDLIKAWLAGGECRMETLKIYRNKELSRREDQAVVENSFRRAQYQICMILFNHENQPYIETYDRCLHYLRFTRPDGAAINVTFHSELFMMTTIPTERRYVPPPVHLIEERLPPIQRRHRSRSPFYEYNEADNRGRGWSLGEAFPIRRRENEHRGARLPKFMPK